ncbi:hypothetical protein P8C59_009383 [Phyllachora maydis]|uniref:Uncharacterized protein n=1 Tax=Phyllachora maydis TaxID=1825666 RepID=A0AAD9MFK0_9PEZI|nr:hypothetical protein P8C59_009383 [Phyllachora maydis]
MQFRAAIIFGLSLALVQAAPVSESRGLGGVLGGLVGQAGNTAAGLLQTAGGAAAGLVGTAGNAVTGLLGAAA